MNKAVSIYLDLLRFVAAIIVFIVHANYEKFTGGLPFLWRLSNVANDAVMIFFVLSGFVIAYVANEKEKTLYEFSISRFARLYSVVVPALILTVLIEKFVLGFSYQFPLVGLSQCSESHFLCSIASLLFVNQIWFFDAYPAANVPFWSIGYEFWYYFIFAAAFYINGFAKYVILIIIFSLVGPKILLLLPVWLMGVLAYYISISGKVTERKGWVLFGSSFFIYFFYRYIGGYEWLFAITNSLLGSWAFDALSWSREFLSSYLVGVIVAANLVGFATMPKSVSSLLERTGGIIKYCASYTFAMYLLHYPLLYFFAAISYDEITQTTSRAVVVFGTLIAIWLLGAVTEKQKNKYKKVFDYSCRRLFTRL